MRTVIIGGGAAGASCAARLRRLDESMEIIILEKTNEVSIANCGLPYYVSGVIGERDKILVSNPTVFKELLNVEVRLNSTVVKIDRENKSIEIKKPNHTELTSINYDKLVLAVGANPIKPPIKGIENEKIFTVRTLNDADRIKEYVKEHQPKNAVVIGGGFISVEMAENMVHLGIETSLIELQNQILTPYDQDMVSLVQNEMRENGVNLLLSEELVEFEENNIVLKSGTKIPFDIAILAIGVRPETSIISESGIITAKNGAIKVNEKMQTNDHDIFAAGDSVEVIDFVTNQPALIPLAGPANRQGRIIADNICNKNSTYNKSQGTSILKVFDLSIAGVGKNEKQLQAQNIEYKKIHIWGNSHAGYYPNALPLLLKILFDEQGRILGAQAVGAEGADKRIDVISTVMRMNGCIKDLLDSELCYAPPYSSAKDPSNILAMAAENVLEGIATPAFYEDLKESYIIDVRPAISFSMSKIEGAINIPAEEIRNRLDEIPKDKEVILYCNKGFTSYVASRILKQNGFENIKSLSGGILLYKEIVKNNQGNILQTMIKNEQIDNTTNHEIVTIDACAMQCPGPILKLANTIKDIEEGQIIEISVTDSGFKSDIEGWCKTTGNSLLEVNTKNKITKAKIQKGNKKQEITPGQKEKNAKTIVVFSNDLDKALAAFIIANGAAASGKPVTLFFTFWGLNILRKTNYVKTRKNIIETLFSMLMPKGAENLTLSKMNMGGVGSSIMKWVMKSKNVSSLEELIKTAQSNNVKFVACNMSMEIMGIKQEELIDNIEIAGVAKYISETDNANSNLFI